MGLKFLSLKGERGDASIFLAMILALTVGTTVYYNMDKLNQTLKSNKVLGQKQKAETHNISGLSTATALMSYTGANPRSDDAAALPYLYPDPYFPGTTMGTPRSSPTVDTWNFASMKLEVSSPSDADLKGIDFENYVKPNGTRPVLNNKSSIRFIKPVYDSTNVRLIKGYEAEITSNSFDNQKLVSKATIPVPKPEPPVCVLRSTNGQTKFQPNAPMNLELVVSGLALMARLPMSAEALLAPESDFSEHFVLDLTAAQRANSVTRINDAVRTWTVTTPRPLVAVDGTNEVTFETYAYLSLVTNNNETAMSCPFRFTVAAPAYCKLWTDKATVAPGQCVNITSETVGLVQANSLQMAAKDPTGKAVAGLTQNGANGTFCAPSTSNYGIGVTVPTALASTFASALSTLDTDQQKAVYEQLKSLVGNLEKLFDKIPELHNLSINQYNDLFSLGLAHKQDMANAPLDTFVNLATLTTEQLAALRSTTEQDFNKLNAMKPIVLAEDPLLTTVDGPILNSLSSFDPKLLMAHVGSGLDAAANSSAVPVDYKILGSITANDGSKNSCLVHVTAGTNKCPFFGSQFPTFTQTQTITHVSDGQQGSFSVDFAPAKPNWEVAGIATSPTNVEPCPPNARCYAVDIGGNRTPFTVVDSAHSQTCSATTNLRVDLGCFEANTKIRMADGTDKPIRQLKDNDLVWNPIRDKAVAIKRVTPGPEKLPLWTVQTDEGTVRVTAKHPFLTPTGLKATDELKAGERIMGRKGERVIQQVAEDRSAPSEWVWNFELATDSKDPADHAILADGVVTGDLYLQEQLAQFQTKKLSQLKP